MTHLTKYEEGQTLKISIWELPGACTQNRLLSTHRRNCFGHDFDDLVFLIYCQEHRSSFYMETIRKHDGQVSTYIPARGHHSYVNIDT